MRKAMTDAERRFWHAVRAKKLGPQFRRQVPIAGYIVDFVCHDSRLIVEIDGGTHGTKAEIAHDQLRTERLQQEGYRVIRFWNDEITRNLPLLLDQLAAELAKPLSPTLPHKGGG
jgi:very-short-patch-repair endonuclease